MPINYVVGMEECELCGAKAGDIYVINVEDVELRVCTKCAKGKKIVAKAVQKNAPKGFAKENKNEEPQLVENYGSVIHDARESMKLPLKVLAEMINEKETLLLRIEQQRTLPSVALTKKLEKALSIRLAEPEQQNKNVVISAKKEATLGDFVANK